MKEFVNISLSLVIPVYNNESTIVSGIKKCRNLLEGSCKRWEILIGEDGSTDRTRELLEAHFSDDPRIHMYIHGRNQGIGRNIYFLYSKARLSYTALFSIDGDWELADLRGLIKAASKAGNDIIVGSREQKNGYTFDRRIISYLFNDLSKRFFGVDCVDPGSIKMFKTRWFRSMDILSRSQFFEAELIIRIVKNGGTMSSIPVQYHKKTNGKDMWSRVGGALSAFADLVRVYWSM